MTVDSILTDEELRFLGSQNILTSKVFDAEGMPKWLYRVLMKEAGVPFACRTTPCRKGNHRLRTRSGHCIQCDTSKIAFMLRWHSAGYIYVAYSPFLELTKIGFSEDASARIATLNSIGYGGGNDWMLIQEFYCVTDGGKKEAAAQRLVSNSQMEIYYIREYVSIRCYEVYACSPEDAITACEDAMATG